MNKYHFTESVFKQYTSTPAPSLGLKTTTGCYAHPPIVAIASGMGYDLSAHITTAWPDFEIQQNDLYVCTEPQHLETLLKYHPTANVILLGGMSEKAIPYIHDPYNTSGRYRVYCLELLLTNTKILANAIF